MFKKVKLPVFLIVLFMSSNLFAVPTDLAVKFLDKANVALEESNLEDAYKYVNQALVVVKDVDDKSSEKVQKKVLTFAQNIYEQKLHLLVNKYDEMDFIDVKMNLDKYPKVYTDKITKLITNIESVNNESLTENGLADFGQKEDVGNVESDREKKLESDDEYSIDEFGEFLSDKENSNYEYKKDIESSIVDMGHAFIENAEESNRSTKVMVFAITSIAIIVLIIILLIVIICKKGFTQQQVQQEQYIQAFKILASNQKQTNNIMLGGVTDIYGGNSPLKFAGSSKWTSAAALPDVEFSTEDEKELKTLAVKCEEIGSKIDSVTGRKNNSKNVSEIVYKLSLQLGLSQNMAMLNFCAAMIYDAGFLGIDPDLLSLGSLSDDEKKSNERTRFSR